MADLDTVAIVTAALAGKKNRASLGGEWHVASYIVSRMVHAPKCRAADDLLLAAENHPLSKERVHGWRPAPPINQSTSQPGLTRCRSGR